MHFLVYIKGFIVSYNSNNNNNYELTKVQIYKFYIICINSNVFLPPINKKMR